MASVPTLPVQFAFCTLRARAFTLSLGGQLRRSVNQALLLTCNPGGGRGQRERDGSER